MLKLLCFLCIIPGVLQAQEVMISLPANTHPLYDGPYTERTLARINFQAETISIVAQPFDSCGDDPAENSSLAYHPSGDLHCMTADAILVIDTGDLSITLFDTTLAHNYSDTDNLLSQAKYGPGGNLYFMTSASSVFNTRVGIYDFSTQSVTEVGDIKIDGQTPFWLYDICIANGDLYALGVALQPGWSIFEASLIKIDPDHPDSSRVVYRPEIPTQLHYASVVNFDCDSSQIIMRSYPLGGMGNLTAYAPGTGAVELFFQNDIPGGKFAHPSESQYFDCTPVLDLSYGEDSSYHYTAPPICYLASTQFSFLSNADPIILSNTTIDSISIHLAEDSSMFAQEELTYAGSLPYRSTSEGLVVRRPAPLTNEEFLAQVKDSLFYTNNTPPTNTSYERRLELLAYKRSYASDTAFVSLLLHSVPTAGEDILINYCSTDEPIHLDDVLSAADSGGTWYPETLTAGLFSPATDTITNFSYQIDNGLCADTAFVDFQESTLPVFSLGPDQTIIDGEEIQLMPDEISAGTYTWQDGSSSPTLTINSPGLYFLTITNRADCSFTDSVIVTLTTGITTIDRSPIELPTVISKSSLDYPAEMVVPTLPHGFEGTFTVYSAIGQAQCIKCLSWPTYDAIPRQGIYFYHLLITTPSGRKYRQTGSVLVLE